MGQFPERAGDILGGRFITLIFLHHRFNEMIESGDDADHCTCNSEPWCSIPALIQFYSNPGKNQHR